MLKQMVTEIPVLNSVLMQWTHPYRPRRNPVNIYLDEIDKVEIMSLFSLMLSRYFSSYVSVDPQLP